MLLINKKKANKHRSIMLIAVIALFFLGAFMIGTAALQSIRANVRNTTIQVIQEITNSKSQILTAILEESERDLGGLAAALEASKDQSSAAALLERFEKDHVLGGLTIIDLQGHTLYGPGDAYLLKGIPPEFAQQAAADGFAMSDTLIGVDGERRVLFGTLLAGEALLYASLPTDSLQKACGETTYLGEGYSYILGRDGKIVIPPVRYSYEQVYENIRNLLDRTDNSAEKIDRFIEALDAGATGSVVFHIDGQEQLFCFQPLY